MADTAQISVALPDAQRTALEQLSAQSGRSIASIVREAVGQFLQGVPAVAPLITADALFTVLRDPDHWLTFKQIAIEMEGVTQAAEPVIPVSVEAAPAQPTWKFRRDKGVAGRNNQPPAPAKDDEPPF